VLRNRVSARLMCCLATVSESLGTRFCEYNGLPVDKFRVVRAGADLSAVDHVTPEEASPCDDRSGFFRACCGGSVGRLVEQKDYPTQLRHLRGGGPVPQLRMVLAGDGPLAARFDRWSGSWRRRSRGLSRTLEQGARTLAQSGHLRAGVEVRTVWRGDSGSEAPAWRSWRPPS
jgi:hypothetical protein